MNEETIRPGDRRSFADLTKELIDDISRLFRQELKLVQSEANEKISQVQSGVISLAAGLLIGIAALIILLQALVVALSEVMEPWLAAVIVGVVTAIVALILVGIGRRNLAATNLTPERSMRSARDTGKAVREKLS